MTITLVSAAARPDLVDEAETMSSSQWPVWLKTAAIRAYWSDLYTPALAPFQTFGIDETTGAVVAIGNSIPFLQPETLPATGWDWVMEAGAIAARNGTPVDSLSALAVTIAPAHRGTGLAVRLLKAMKLSALAAGLTDMVAPVRPTLKPRYPLQDFPTYCGWRGTDGMPFDPWLRTHEQLGATIIGPAMQSMTVIASLSDWEHWTNLRFPTDGLYAIPGALSALHIDLTAGTGTYEEPNLWMRHPLA